MHDSGVIRAAKLDQAGSRNSFQEIRIGQSSFHIFSRDQGMFAPDAFRARSLPVLDGVNERFVMLFRDGDQFLCGAQ